MDVRVLREQLLTEIEQLKKELVEIRMVNAEMIAMVEQILSENKQIKQLVRERLEETQMLRGNMG